MFDFLDLDRLKLYMVSGLISAFGAFTNAIYQKAKGRPVSMSFIVMTIMIGFFVGNLIGSFIPKDFEYRDGFLMIAGFGCYPLLDLIEANVESFFNKIFKKFIG